MIGTLTKLEIHPCFQLRRLEIKRQRIGLTDAAGARKDLSGRQKSKQRSEELVRELRLPLHQIILVTTNVAPVGGFHSLKMMRIEPTSAPHLVVTRII